MEHNNLFIQMLRINQLVNLDRLWISEDGKCKVIGFDRFDQEHWLHGEYDKAEDAVEEAKRMTKASRQFSEGAPVATVYYAYNEKGIFLGGEI